VTPEQVHIAERLSVLIAKRWNGGPAISYTARKPRSLDA